MPLPHDPAWQLAHFTLIADLTTLRAECRFVGEGETVVARYDGLPFAALAYAPMPPNRLATLAAQLVQPDEPFYLLLNAEQAAVAEQAFSVEEVQREWQMLFQGDAEALTGGAAVPLRPGHLPHMLTLAAEAGLTAFESHPFRHGPAFGVWEGEHLIAMGGTHLTIPGFAEIGNIATHPAHRRRGYARQVVGALVRAHLTAGRQVFLMVFQTNTGAIRLYESLGFTRQRPMFLMRCRLAIGGDKLYHSG